MRWERHREREMARDGRETAGESSGGQASRVVWAGEVRHEKTTGHQYLRLLLSLIIYMFMSWVGLLRSWIIFGAHLRVGVRVLGGKRASDGGSP